MILRDPKNDLFLARKQEQQEREWEMERRQWKEQEKQGHSMLNSPPIIDHYFCKPRTSYEIMLSKGYVPKIVEYDGNPSGSSLSYIKSIINNPSMRRYEESKEEMLIRMGYDIVWEDLDNGTHF